MLKHLKIKFGIYKISLTGFYTEKFFGEEVKKFPCSGDLSRNFKNGMTCVAVSGYRASVSVSYT